MANAIIPASNADTQEVLVKSREQRESLTSRRTRRLIQNDTDPGVDPLTAPVELLDLVISGRATAVVWVKPTGSSCDANVEFNSDNAGVYETTSIAVTACADSIWTPVTVPAGILSCRVMFDTFGGDITSLDTVTIMTS